MLYFSLPFARNFENFALVRPMPKEINCQPVAFATILSKFEVTSSVSQGIDGMSFSQMIVNNANYELFFILYCSLFCIFISWRTCKLAF